MRSLIAVSRRPAALLVAIVIAAPGGAGADPDIVSAPATDYFITNPDGADIRAPITAVSSPAALMASGDIGVLLNSATIAAPNGYAVAIPGVTTFTNSGRIEAPSGPGAYFMGAVNGTLTNAGTITGMIGVGLDGGETVAFINTGTGVIEGQDRAFFALTGSLGRFTNAGTIVSSGESGVSFGGMQLGEVTNDTTGSIEGATAGMSLNAAGLTEFVNRGRIANTDPSNGSGLVMSAVNLGSTATHAFTNGPGALISGTQSGAMLSQVAFGTLTNAGTIEGREAFSAGLILDTSTIGTLSNTAQGSITGGAFGLMLRNSAVDSIDNSGTIEGDTGIAFDGNFGGSGSVTSSGTIRGTGGTAIDFEYGCSPCTPRDDTLILRDAAQIIGAIKFGAGNDTLNFSAYTGSADLTVHDLEDLVAGDRLYRWQASDRLTFEPMPADPPGDDPPSVPSPDSGSIDAPGDVTPDGEPSTSPAPPHEPPPSGPGHVVIVAPEAVTPAVTGPSLTGITQGIAGLVGTRVLAGQMNTVAAGYSSSLLSPVAAAGGRAVLTALDVGEGERPRLWGDMFGYSSSGPSASQLTGLAVGADTKLIGRLSAGALLSYSQSSARFAAGDHALSSHSGVAGFYGTWHAGIVDVGFSLLGGLQAHQSFRRVATAGGIETAHGAFTGVFAAPGLSASLPLVTTGGTSVAARASATYVTGRTAGYTETGATSNLTIGARALHSLDARLGLDARQALGLGEFAGEAMLRGGVFALLSGGSASVPVTLLGQTVDVVATYPAVYGIYAGTGVAADLAPATRLELNADTAARLDGTLSLSLRGGLSGSF